MVCVSTQHLRLATLKLDTALHWAAYEGHARVAGVLISPPVGPKSSAPANVLQRDRYGATALDIAACRGHTSVVAVCLAQSEIVKALRREASAAVNLASASSASLLSLASTSSVYPTHASPAHWAAAHSHYAILTAILDAVPYMAVIPDSDGATPLHHAAYSGSPDVLHALFNGPAGHIAKMAVHRGDRDGCTPLHWASDAGDVSMVRVLLEAGAAVNKSDKTGRTPLHWASRSGHGDVIDILTEAGAELDVHDDDGGVLPIGYAAERGHVKAIEALLNAGAEVDGKNTEGLTPLMYAAFRGHVPVITCLMAASADVNIQDALGRTALHWAVHGGETGAVGALMADPDLKPGLADEEGMTALHFAVFLRDLPVCEALIQRAPDLVRGWEDAPNATPLHLAAGYGVTEALTLFQSLSPPLSVASVNAKDEDGTTALDWALEHGQATSAGILRHMGATSSDAVQSVVDAAAAKGLLVPAAASSGMGSNNLSSIANMKSSQLPTASSSAGSHPGSGSGTNSKLPSLHRHRRRTSLLRPPLPEELPFVPPVGISEEKRDLNNLSIPIDAGGYASEEEELTLASPRSPRSPRSQKAQSPRNTAASVAVPVLPKAPQGPGGDDPGGPISRNKSIPTLATSKKASSVAKWKAAAQAATSGAHVRRVAPKSPRQVDKEAPPGFKKPAVSPLAIPLVNVKSPLSKHHRNVGPPSAGARSSPKLVRSPAAARWRGESAAGLATKALPSPSSLRAATMAATASRLNTASPTAPVYRPTAPTTKSMVLKKKASGSGKKAAPKKKAKAGKIKARPKTPRTGASSPMLPFGGNIMSSSMVSLPTLTRSESSMSVRSVRKSPGSRPATGKSKASSRLAVPSHHRSN